MKLDGTTANLVHDLFGTTSNNLLAATLTIVPSCSEGSRSANSTRTSRRVWRIHVGSVAEQLLFTIWFFVTSGLIALMTVSAGRSEGAASHARAPVPKATPGNGRASREPDHQDG